MAYFITETCVGCAACTWRCPTGAISGVYDELHVIDAQLCIDCDACGVVCPVDCIHDAHGEQTFLLESDQWPLAFVDERACTGCDKCTPRCPFDALALVEVSQSEFPGVVTVVEQRCTGCRECERACPYDAIFVFRRDQVPDWLVGATIEKTDLPALANSG